jgi:hypothetical protein
MAPVPADYSPAVTAPTAYASDSPKTTAPTNNGAVAPVSTNTAAPDSNPAAQLVTQVQPSAPHDPNQASASSMSTSRKTRYDKYRRRIDKLRGESNLSIGSSQSVDTKDSEANIVGPDPSKMRQRRASAPTITPIFQRQPFAVAAPPGHPALKSVEEPVDENEEEVTDKTPVRTGISSTTPMNNTDVSSVAPESTTTPTDAAPPANKSSTSIPNVTVPVKLAEAKPEKSESKVNLTGIPSPPPPSGLARLFRTIFCCTSSASTNTALTPSGNLLISIMSTCFNKHSLVKTGFLIDAGKMGHTNMKAPVTLGQAVYDTEPVAGETTSITVSVVPPEQSNSSPSASNNEAKRSTLHLASKPNDGSSQTAARAPAEATPQRRKSIVAGIKQLAQPSATAGTAASRRPSVGESKQAQAPATTATTTKPAAPAPAKPTPAKPAPAAKAAPPAAKGKGTNTVPGGAASIIASVQQNGAAAKAPASLPGGGKPVRYWLIL